ncbi:MAG: short-chain dehydrogenase [Rhizobiales bacterium TMED249]|uniref:SDR family NAD(P)-dependent oxidoreductase n=1 Tax=PS1 clade bacterium TaxID=2175152 RepID=A0A368E0H2_9PROT|nr:SDR family oxidoreductase [Alphaproteobacteria bacterium]OUX19810.1 MAG: short-chain dehydrogenase [Rhizobiales bacterium TMED249]RCL77036.1 MAG: SDR family NAD(P)-dependent oxidoreductase [PS1 clade bacterium]|tara:strand:+ start:2435 stop:3190 length:756 start_codon:yes stop_codon:yes gene_type:complete
MTIKYDFSGYRVLVTGGTSGIGLSAAGMYRDAGADVVITGTKPRENYDVDLSGFSFKQMDLEDNASIDAVAKNVSAEGGLDVLVNNAGLAFASQGLDEHDPDVFARAIQMHLTGVYRLSHGLVDRLAESKLPGGGAIVNIASVTSFMGVDVTLGYGAAKTGILGLIRGMAVDLGKRNIRVNAVAAGLTQTGMTSIMFDNSEWTDPVLKRTPLQRLGKPDDIAGAVLFASSSAAQWMTGQALVIDGGFTIFG